MYNTSQKVGQILEDSAIIMLTDGFEQDTIMPIVAKIMAYNLQPKELQPEYITLVINSPGGSAHSCFHLIDIMKTSKIPVHTIAMGITASCGVLTLMAGAKGHRCVTQNTSILSHTWSWGASGTSFALEAANVEFELSNQRMMAHYRKCTGKSEKYITKHLVGPTDSWLTGEEAVKHGLIDFVKETY
jgi:ATP-dependent Clp protease protease subunit